MLGAAVAFGLVALGGKEGAAAPGKARVHRPERIVDASGDRPLTIARPRRHGIVRTGNDIVAPGGFSAHGYGYPAASADDRRAAVNARIRASASGPYGYGIGGTGFGGDRDGGDSNPFWGNGFSGYVGYNGVPTDLAFGPGFANRHLAEPDPDDEDEPGPTPGDLGYALDPRR